MSQDKRMLARVTVFTVVLLWMQAGPVAHVLGFDKPPGTMTWLMYRGRAGRLCAAQWWTPGPDGERIPVDRAEHTRARRLHATLLEGRKGVREASRKLCQNLEPGTVLRVDARCGTRHGWVTVLQDEQDLCAEPTP